MARDRRTCQMPQLRQRGTNIAQRTTQQQQQRRPQYEDVARAAARRVSVLNLRPQSREPSQGSQQRQAHFVPKSGTGSRESVNAQPTAKATAAQEWFSILHKAGGCRRIRQRFANDLYKFKATGPTEAFGKEQNADFNRYSDVPLLDSTRIKLRKGPDGNDYIHASLVTGADFPIICAQGPVDESIERFWAMVVEKKCGVIVQLCQNEEDGKEKCANYLPTSKDKQRKFGNATVRVREEQKRIVANPSLRKTVVEAEYNGEKVEVVHFLFDGWPDHDVPIAPNHFRQLRTTVHTLAMAKRCPVVVHCSAGIGRTGTYAAIEIAIRRLVREKKPVQIPDVFHRLRGERALAIQNDLQYLFVHRAVVDAALEAGQLVDDREKIIHKFISEYDVLVVRKRKERREIMERKKQQQQ